MNLITRTEKLLFQQTDAVGWLGDSKGIRPPAIFKANMVDVLVDLSAACTLLQAVVKANSQGNIAMVKFRPPPVAPKPLNGLR